MTQTKHFLDSGIRELAESLDKPRTDERGRLIETCKDEDVPEIGYSDPYALFDSGNTYRIRHLFHKGYVIGYEMMYFPWNILAPTISYYELPVPDDCCGSDSTFHGKKVVPVDFSDDESCVRFDDLREFFEFFQKHLTDYIIPSEE